MWLKVTEVAISYYEWISRLPTAGNIKWYPWIKNLSVQWKAIQYLKKNDDATLPKISKMVSIVNVFEAYESHACQIIV